jgi:predicted DNA-binding transcriptional regulator AlpA
MDTISTSESSSVAPSIIRTSQDLRLPRWVNEPLPDLRALLTANEISRLTRRPRWLLLGLAVLGRFPKQRTHCGKPVGWHRADVLDWLTQNMAIEDDCKVEARTCRSARPRQACLPLEMDATHHPVCIPQRRHATGGNRS